MIHLDFHVLIAILCMTIYVFTIPVQYIHQTAITETATHDMLNENVFARWQSKTKIRKKGKKKETNHLLRRWMNDLCNTIKIRISSSQMHSNIFIKNKISLVEHRLSLLPTFHSSTIFLSYNFYTYLDDRYIYHILFHSHAHTLELLLNRVLHLQLEFAVHIVWIILIFILYLVPFHSFISFFI